MVKCPRGTNDQIKANWAYLKSPRRCDLFNTDPEDAPACTVDPCLSEEVEYPGEDTYLSDIDYDDIRADKRCPPTTEDEVTYLFVNHFLEILLKSWHGTPCRRPKLLQPVESVEGEQSGPESDRPRERSTSFNVSVEYLNDLYKQKLQPNSGQPEKSSMEGRLSAVCRRQCESARSNGDQEDENVEEDKSTESEVSWKTTVPDEEVEMTFQNGSWYKGRVSRRLLDGDGTFFWEDGGSFQGEFVGGAPMGFGRLEFPNLSVYEGTVFRGYRHGEGLHCVSDSPVMYSGEWWLGQKSGHGVILYNDPSKCLDFYKGSWVNGQKEGFGYRQYPSGSKYVGYWKNGKRHGSGVMFWCNHDIYRGEWKDGQMEGFGEYIWNGFINKTFSYPKVNTFRGFWENGKRNGTGLLELTNGSFIETVWVNNEKNGPGAAICPNGTLIVEVKQLFRCDKPAMLNAEEEDLTGLLFRSQGVQTGKKKHLKKDISIAPDEEQHLAFMSSVEKAKAISIPIHTPVHTLDLTCHVKRLQEQKNEFYIRRSEQVSAFTLKNTPRMEGLNEAKAHPDQDINQLEDISLEEKLLRFSVLINLTRLKDCYDEWATVACAEKPPFKCTLLRLFFWDLLTKAAVPQRNFSLVDIDEILAREETFVINYPHDPFERIQLWQFIHFLITISWYLYGRYVYAESVGQWGSHVGRFLESFYNQNEKAVLASAFKYFLDNHIFTVGDLDPDRDILKNKDLVPMQGMYMVYKDVGEPHSAKQFLSAVCLKSDDTSNPFDAVRFIEKIPEHKILGTNVVTFTSEPSYLPSDNPFNHPELFPVERATDGTESKSELKRFAHLGPKCVVKCLTRVCPTIVEEDLIVDMEYQLTFLEFYKVVIACAEMSIRKKALKEMQCKIISEYKQQLEEYEKQMMEYEKQKEATAALTRKVSHVKKTKK